MILVVKIRDRRSTWDKIRTVWNFAREDSWSKCHSFCGQLTWENPSFCKFKIMKYRNLYHLGPFPHIKSMFPLFSGFRYDRRCQNDCLTVWTIENHIKSTKKNKNFCGYIIVTHFVAKVEKCCAYSFLGIRPDYFNITMGGKGVFITILHIVGGGEVSPIHCNIT